jgi:hypothetical protein
MRFAGRLRPCHTASLSTERAANGDLRGDQPPRATSNAIMALICYDGRQRATATGFVAQPRIVEWQDDIAVAILARLSIHTRLTRAAFSWFVRPTGWLPSNRRG